MTLNGQLIVLFLFKKPWFSVTQELKLPIRRDFRRRNQRCCRVHPEIEHLEDWVGRLAVLALTIGFCG